MTNFLGLLEATGYKTKSVPVGATEDAEHVPSGAIDSHAATLRVTISCAAGAGHPTVGTGHIGHSDKNDWACELASPTYIFAIPKNCATVPFWMAGIFENGLEEKSWDNSCNVSGFPAELAMPKNCAGAPLVTDGDVLLPNESASSDSFCNPLSIDAEIRDPGFTKDSVIPKS